MRLKFLILFTFVVCLPALAQRAGVTGVVVDAKNGEPVIGASVMLDNQGGGVVTDLDGRFRIDNATAGNATLSVMSVGYKKITQTVAIDSAGTTDVGTIRIKRGGYGGRNRSSLGVFAGGNYSLLSGGYENEYGLKLQSGFGCQFGVAYNFHFGRRSSEDRGGTGWVALQAEASCVLQSVKLSLGGNPRRNYAAFGGFVQIYPKKNFYIEVGVEYEHPFEWANEDAYITVSNVGIGYEAADPAWFWFNVGSMVNPVVGIGYRLDNGLGINARYVMNLKSPNNYYTYDLDHVDYVDKISSLQVSLSYMFNL